MIPTIETVTLTHGGHPTREAGMCLLELVAYLADEPHSDHPPCVSEVLGAYGRRLNDALLPKRVDLEPRLRALAPRLLGTAGHPDLDRRAAWLATDHLVRGSLPEWLDLADMSAEADELRAMTELVGPDAERNSRIREIREASWARRLEARKRLSAYAAYAYADADAAYAAYAAYAARDWLAPVVERLQVGCLECFERMVALWDGAR